MIDARRVLPGAVGAAVGLAALTLLGFGGSAEVAGTETQPSQADPGAVTVPVPAPTEPLPSQAGADSQADATPAASTTTASSTTTTSPTTSSPTTTSSTLTTTTSTSIVGSESGGMPDREEGGPTVGQPALIELQRISGWDQVCLPPGSAGRRVPEGLTEPAAARSWVVVGALERSGFVWIVGSATTTLDAAAVVNPPELNFTADSCGDLATASTDVEWVCALQEEMGDDLAPSVRRFDRSEFTSVREACAAMIDDGSPQLDEQSVSGLAEQEGN